MLTNRLLRPAIAACALFLVAACQEGPTTKLETGARTLEGAQMGAAIMARTGLGSADKPLDFDASSLPYLPRPVLIEQCRNMRAGIDSRWTRSEQDTGKSYTLRSNYDGSTHNLRQLMSVYVDSPVPSAMIRIECEKGQSKITDVKKFADLIAASYRKKPGTYASVRRSSTKGWEVIQSVQSRNGTTFDSYTAYQLRGGRRFTVTLLGFRGASTRAPDAKLLPAGTITRINGLNGQSLTLRLSQPAWRNDSAVWGIRTPEAHARFFKEFMDILR